ncbi:MAG: ribonuclease III [Alphaproteobacteria bacterium]|nr:ribonuclease III [Alphaproteobacteria bacterium]
MTPAYKNLCAKLGYTFKDETLLRNALTHPSQDRSIQERGDKKVSPYERLEFLGDRVLSLLIAEWLYEIYPLENEGELAKRHASLVNRDCIAEIAEGLSIADCLQMVNAEDLRRGRVNILSDALEALIGAMYKDTSGKDGAHQLDGLRSIIAALWQPFVHRAAAPQDAKSALQEWAQGKGLPLPEYRVVNQSGPAHAPTYVVAVQVKGYEAIEAQGSSKRDAEKKAATLLWQKLVGV